MGVLVGVTVGVGVGVLVGVDVGVRVGVVVWVDVGVVVDVWVEHDINTKDNTNSKPKDAQIVFLFINSS